ncbi:hypothetical protein [Sulfitobacter sp. M22]|uniref:hypothetical protein n=1 Tax=Sulfitobacter sp. M22 TaxID=2675332 RepID=UPI001F374379|nr:hypothetical protein [Sulfitobacter sp. M22]MCF7725757.1 hypothetical protein [Sulfitobacter sp. M22]
MTPRGHAIAFRIWQFCRPLGWDCTRREIADALGLHVGTVAHVVAAKGWDGRLRTPSVQRHGRDPVDFTLYFDNELDRFSNRQAMAQVMGASQ